MSCLLLPKYAVLSLLFLLATYIKVAFKNLIKSLELPYPRHSMDMWKKPKFTVVVSDQMQMKAAAGKVLWAHWQMQVW